MILSVPSEYILQTLEDLFHSLDVYITSSTDTFTKIKQKPKLLRGIMQNLNRFLFLSYMKRFRVSREGGGAADCRLEFNKLCKHGQLTSVIYDSHKNAILKFYREINNNELRCVHLREKELRLGFFFGEIITWLSWLEIIREIQVYINKRKVIWTYLCVTLRGRSEDTPSYLYLPIACVYLSNL